MIKKRNGENSTTDLNDYEEDELPGSSTKNENNLSMAFSNVKIERKADGTIKIEASQESAELLAMVFKNMSKMFSNISG